MRYLSRHVLVFFSLAFLFIATTASACTDITIKAKDGSIMVGRSMEFGPNLNSQVMTSAEGRNFASLAPDGKPGLSWTAKYGYVFMDFFGTGRAVDGLNEKGLSVGLLYLPGYTKYQTVPAGKDKQALSYFYMADWILGNFSTVGQVKQALKNVYIYAKPINVKQYKNLVFPLHIIVTDASGKSITVEFVNGKMQVSNNVLGILTNSPTFDWQLNNLKNYSNLSPYSPNPVKINGIDYSGTGQGSGAVGLPGDYTPPSRFVKMAFLTQNAFPVANATQALNLAQHIINNVDIPNGVVRGGKGDSNDIPDKTQWVVFKDLTHHILYFKSYDNTTLQAINLNKLNLNKGAPQLSIPVNSKQIIIDATQRFMKS